MEHCRKGTVIGDALNPKLDLTPNFDSGAAEFSVPLECMKIAHANEGTCMARTHDEGGSLTQQPSVEIAPVVPWPGVRNVSRLRGEAQDTHHRFDGNAHSIRNARSVVFDGDDARFRSGNLLAKYSEPRGECHDAG